ncbi:MAG: hypothetical protein WAN17_20640, partial [Candidatus Sulfotelmatobacter sp.]
VSEDRPASCGKRILTGTPRCARSDGRGGHPHGLRLAGPFDFASGRAPKVAVPTGALSFGWDWL